MAFIISFLDVALWLAIISIIVLVMSEMLSPYHGRVKMRINLSRLRRASMMSGVVFFSLAAVRIILGIEIL
jgi:hypothetical protein